MVQTLEQWRPVVGYEGFYEVSDQGNVRSLDRVSHRRFLSGKAVAQRTTKHNYKSVMLWRDGISKTIFVHRLVLIAFGGSQPQGKNHCRHLDGNSANNKIGNLAWGNSAENEADKAAHGRVPLGSAHGMSKLTEESVVAIFNDNRLLLTIAEEYGVNITTISLIKRRRIWKHVLPENALPRGVLSGERHPRSRLTADQVLAIRSDARTGRAIAAAYGVSEATVSEIRSRKAWSHLS